VRPFEALAKHAACGAGGRPQVKYRFWLQQQRLESPQQPVTGHGMNEVRAVKVRRSAVKAPLNVLQSQHEQTVSRFVRVSRPKTRGPASLR
jgi:hypothetical protein